MIAVDVGGMRFQLRTAAVIVHDRAVLLHRLEGDEFWALPGGRIEAGEDARAALVREIDEELAEPVDCRELLYVVENFFAHAGNPYHEVGFYFTACFEPGSKLLEDLSRVQWGVEGSRRLEYRWFELKRLGDIDLRPSFLRQSLARETLTFEHIVQRG